MSEFQKNRTNLLDVSPIYKELVMETFNFVANWWFTKIKIKEMEIFSKVLLSLPVNDLTSGFRCIKRNVLEKIDFATIQSKGYAFLIEEVYRVFLKGFKIKEYPIIFKGRKNEKSKMSFGIVIEAFFKVMFLCVKRNLR